MDRSKTLQRALSVLSMVAFASASGLSAQVAVTIESLLLDGDVVAGVGSVTSIDNFTINNNGSWLIEADTDNADTEADSVLLQDGVVLLREGDALTEPAGATIDSFDAITLNLSGDSSWNFFLDGTAGNDDDSGVYFGTDLLIQEGDSSIAPELTPGTPYIGFFETKINDAGSVLLMASVDDANIESTVDRVLTVLELTDGGELLSETVIAKEGDLLDGQTEPVTDFDTGPHNFDFNNSGQAVVLADLSGDADSNAAIYRLDSAGQTLLAQEGSPSPLSGRNWETLTSPELSLNNNGQTLFSGNLDGDQDTDSLIVLEGSKLLQEGDVLGPILPFALETFGTGPLLLSDDGDVLWFGEWSSPDGDTDSGLFYNSQLIVQEGVTAVDGVLIDTLRGVQEGYAMSDDGNLLLFEAVLDDGRDGAFLVTVSPGAAPVLGAATPGTAGVVNTFEVTGASPGATIGFLIGPNAGSSPVPICILQNFGIGNPLIVLGTTVANASGDATLSAFIPAQAAGQELQIQALDVSQCAPSNLVSQVFG